MFRTASFRLSAVLGLALLTSGAALAADCKPAVPDTALIGAGKLVMSTNPTLPPLQFIDQSGELKGMRVELGKEVAKRLCLTPEYIRIEFSAMIPGLQSGRWDMINTGIFFTPERAKLMYMIPYEKQAISLSVPAGKGATVTKPEDLAGKTVGVEIGGFEENKTKQLSEELKGKGLAPLTIRTFDNFALAYQALRAGQVEAVVSIDGVAKEYADRGDFDRAISGLYATPVALAFAKKDLAEAALKVLNEMKADGAYQKLFDAYGVVPTDGELALAGPGM
ncbi:MULTISPECIES: ABC transporter substrate-binding protein [Chelatococcus]|uniref:Polar amino acid transport system substrate-binding protein n=1 Tax=Chelatococcus caeni TaxID=1348468 RepID=A0A840C0N6_9HYPH|nr:MULTISPECIES: ABC transporter substrate-binding protein [Chelatococcus]ALA16868.1 amino acid ABC transporter [Chelatococcus sp. CO-6]MBB4017542.1 polar amino acid transport system substrate-binding protein [Chelatococcus caeni]